MKKLIYAISLVIGIFSTHIALAQGADCASMTGFCTNSGSTFNAGVNVLDADLADPGNDYGCLSTSPNPAWYYLEIDNPGAIDILLTNSNGYDIDFALWGPFANLGQAQAACGTYGAPIDCSYSIAATEQVSVPSSLTGQVYVLLITNYSNLGTNISAAQNGGLGSTNCAVLCGTVGFDMSPVGPYDCNDPDVDLTAWDYATAGAYIMPSFSFVVNTDFFSDIDNSVSVYQNSVAGPLIGTFPIGSIPASTTWTLTGTYFNAGTTYVIEWCDAFPDGQFPYQLIDNASGAVLFSGIFDNDNGTNCYTLTFQITGTALFSGPGVTSGTNGTGVFSPSTVGAGTYSITYSWDNGNGCSGTASQNVLVTNPNDATWTPPGPLCQTGAAVNLDSYVTGTAGGTWSGTGVTGSTFNPAGLSGSIPVTYTVGSGNCIATQTQNIVVNVPVGSANFSYTANSFCQNNPIQNITLGLGASIGVFTYTTVGGSLSLNAATGAFDPATSTPGTYTVTNTVSGVPPCANITFSQTVTIVAAPLADFTYFSNIFCQTAGLQNITLGAGATLGSFTYTGAGFLSLNSSTGTIDPSISLPGTYNVTNTVIGTAPCGNVSASQSITIVASPAISINPANPAAVCVGASVQLDAVPAVGGISYQWFLNGVAIPGATGSTYFATTSGNYTVQASALGCTSMSPIAVVTISPAPPATITPAGATTFCAGGSVILDANVGAGYTYQWYLNGVAIVGATGASYIATAAGSYTVEVSVGTCTTPSAAQVVTVNPSPTAVITPQGALSFCVGGSVILDATTGVGYTYQWYLNGVAIAGATGASYTANASGSYSVDITDNGCTSPSAPVTVVVNPQPTATITPASATTFCSGGSVTLNASTGAGYSYQWYFNGVAIAGATTSSYVANASGNYTVEVSIGACISTSLVETVTVNPTPSAVITPQSALSFCTGGSVILDATTGVGYTYQWYLNGVAIAGATNSAYTAIASGNYSVDITDNGCTGSSIAVTVTINPAPTATITAAGATTFCVGSSVLINASTGAGYFYQWYLNGVAIGGATSSNYTATTAGSYTVDISLGTCVSSSNAIVITVNPLPTAAVTPAGPTSFCAGGNVILDATTGAGYSYQWNLNGAAIAGATGTSYTATSSGLYSVTVTLNGCSATSATVSVMVNAIPIATITPTGATTFCAGGSVGLNASSGANYTYQWNLNGTAIAGATTSSYVANAAGSYTVTISALGCVATSAAVTIVVNPSPNSVFQYDNVAYCLTAANPILSFPTGGIAGTFTVSPNGLNLNPLTGAVTIAGSQAGTYTVTNTVTTNGCTSANSVTLTLTNTIDAIFNYGGNVAFCQTGNDPSPAYPNGSFPGTFTVMPNSGLSLNAANGFIDLSLSQPGTYTITNTPIPSTCSGLPFSLTITVSPGLNAEFTYASAVYCLDAGTNPTVSHNNGGANGTYSAIVILGGSVSLDPNTGTINLATSTAGVYYILNTIAANGGCAGEVWQDTITLENPADAMFMYDKVEYCQNEANPILTHPIGATDGMYSSLPNTGLSYDFATGAIDLALSVPGTYTITNDIAAGLACAASTHSQTLTIYAAPSAQFDYDAITYCKEGAAPVLTHSIGTDGAYTYNVLSGGPLLSITPTNGSISLLDSDFGTYQITNIVPGNGVCPPDTQTQTITIDPQPNAEFYYDKTVFCGAGSSSQALHVSGVNGIYSYTGGSNLALNPATGTINLASSNLGTYFVTNVVPSTGACPADTHTVTITYAEQPIANVNPTGTIDLCATGAVNLQANGGGNYAWYFGTIALGVTSSSYTTNTPGTYWVIVSNAAGCADTSEMVTVLGGAQPSATILPAQTQICAGQNLVLQASGNGNFQWLLNGNVLAGETNPSLQVTQSGTYSFVASNACGTDSATINVSVSPGPMADFFATPNPGYVGEITTFTDQSISGAVWAWDFGTNNGFSILQNPLFTYETAGTYQVTMYVEDVFGCKDTITHPVTIYMSQPDSLFVPNVFSPNGDQVYEEWEVYAMGLEDYAINVYDRWGTKVFEAISPLQKWNGNRPSGSECPAGVYYYAISYTDDKGNKAVRKGNITLLR